MIEFINNKDRTVINFLESFHLSKTNIYKIVSNKLISFVCDDIEYNDLKNDDVIMSSSIVYINIEALEEVDNYFVNYKEKDDLDVIYEDSNYLVVNKPRGILVHDDGNNTQTLLDKAKNHVKLNKESCVIRCVHRLDLETSGVIIFTKNILIQSYLDYLMSNNQITKRYRALVNGIVESDGEIDNPIGRNRHKNGEYIVSKTGKTAFTSYKVLKKYKNKTLLEVKIKTGRTHQIRVHLAYIKHPIIGDKIYGHASSDKMMLQASSIGYIDYNGVYIEFKVKDEF